MTDSTTTLEATTEEEAASGLQAKLAQYDNILIDPMEGELAVSMVNGVSFGREVLRIYLDDKTVADNSAFMHREGYGSIAEQIKQEVAGLGYGPFYEHEPHFIFKFAEKVSRTKQ